MSKPPPTRAEQIRRAMGTADRRDRVTVTGTRRNSGKLAPLRTFTRDWVIKSWSLDTGYLNRRLDSGDPADVDRVISALMSRRHARLGPNRDTWHLTQGVDVPIGIMSVILDALHDAGRTSVAVDDVKTVVSQLGREIGKFIGLPADSQQHARAALHKEILRRCASFE